MAKLAMHDKPDHKSLPKAHPEISRDEDRGLNYCCNFYTAYILHFFNMCKSVCNINYCCNFYVAYILRFFNMCKTVCSNIGSRVLSDRIGLSLGDVINVCECGDHVINSN